MRNAMHELRRRGVLMVEQGGRGGVADYTRCLAKALAERGIPITIATAEDHLYGTIAGVQIVPVFRYVRGHSAAAGMLRRMGLGPVLNGICVPRLAAPAGVPDTHARDRPRPGLGAHVARADRDLDDARVSRTDHLHGPQHIRTPTLGS